MEKPRLSISLRSSKGESPVLGDISEFVTECDSLLEEIQVRDSEILRLRAQARRVKVGKTGDDGSGLVPDRLVGVLLGHGENRYQIFDPLGYLEFDTQTPDNPEKPFRRYSLHCRTTHSVRLVVTGFFRRDLPEVELASCHPTTENPYVSFDVSGGFLAVRLRFSNACFLDELTLAHEGVTRSGRRRLFPPKERPISTVPMHDLVYREAWRQSYRSTGPDPQFFFRQALPKGWYLLRLDLEGDPADRPELYVDRGAGFASNLVFYFHREDGRFWLLYCIQGDEQGFRLDPFQREASFRISSFTIKPMNRLKAHRLIYGVLAGPSGTLSNRVREWAFLFLSNTSERAVQYRKAFQSFLHHGSSAQGQDRYQSWLRLRGKSVGRRTSEDLLRLGYRPVISFVVPVFNTEPRLLMATVRSVLAQSYPYWELCMADDCSTRQETSRTVERLTTLDQRIKTVRRHVNGNISRALNSALELATGDFVAFLDHDDLVTPDALWEIVAVLQGEKKPQVIYSDEDKIDQAGVRREPFFKPAFNPALLLCQNYINHLLCVRTSLVRNCGGFRVGFEGSQDHDLLLRLAGSLEMGDFVHIPKILYHWRIVEGSTALDASGKTYTTEAGLHAVRDAVSHDASSLKVVSRYPNIYQVEVVELDRNPLVSIVIPTRDCLGVLRKCVDSLFQVTTYKNYEILIVDNNSVEPTTLQYFDSLARRPNVVVLKYPHDFNYSAINNDSVSRAKGDYVVLLNNDIEVLTPDWIQNLLWWAMKPHVGAVGAKLYYTDDRIQHAGVVLGIGGVAGHPFKGFPGDSYGYFGRLMTSHFVSAVTGAALMVRRGLYQEIGGLNEVDLPVAFNDIDFCIRLQEAGFYNVLVSHVEMYHHESFSRGEDSTPENRARFEREVHYMKTKYGELLANDPFYNRNLSLEDETYSLSLMVDP